MVRAEKQYPTIGKAPPSSNKIRGLVCTLWPLAILVLISCSKKSSGNGDGYNGNEPGEPPDGFALDGTVEDVPDQFGATDVELDAQDSDIPGGPSLECVVPIRECGEACRQVTCAGIVFEPWGWDVDGSVIVYYTLSRGSLHGVGMYTKDLETGEEKRVLAYPDDYFWCKYLSFSNNTVAYDIIDTSDDYDLCFRALHIFALESAVDSIATCYTDIFEESGTMHSLDMFGNSIVWHGKGEGDILDHSDLFLFDLSTWEKSRLTNRQACVRPRIWENQVVCAGYVDSTDGSKDVLLHDIETGEIRNLTQSPTDQTWPVIWENRVAWVDFRNGSCADIYWCDLLECEPQPATTNGACQDLPALEGDWIAWHDFRNDSNPLGYGSADHDNIEIWGYNISTGQEYQLGSFSTIIGDHLRIVNGKLYFQIPSDPETSILESGSIFEIDLSSFL